MRIAVGSDDIGFPLMAVLVEYLDELGIEHVDYGARDATPIDYPDVAAQVAEVIAGGEFERGILVCGTGLGMAIAANKVPGVRAATCHDVYSAERARKSNDAQVITMGSRVIGPEISQGRPSRLARFRVPGRQLGAQGRQDQLARRALAQPAGRVTLPVSEHHAGTLVPACYEAVVFDLDGVLLDTERLCSEVEAALCAEHGIAYGPLEQSAVLGLDAYRACVYYADRFGLPGSAAAELEQRYEVMLLAAIQRDAVPLPGARELIARLDRAGVALGVASNSRRVVVELAMEVARIATGFRAIVSADDVRRPKPAPDPYARACAQLAVQPTRALAIEDSSVGARSALAAGLDCYALGSLGAQSASGVLRTLASLADLIAS